MTALKWDETGKRRYETGVSKGVLYLPTDGLYSLGVAWNGLVTVTESPSGAEASPQYADNQVYLNLTSAERFGATVHVPGRVRRMRWHCLPDPRRNRWSAAS